jgi:hypothetical protein
VANNLFTFLAQRLASAFDDLGCGKLLHRKNPVTVIVDKHGAAVNARFANVVQPASPAAPRPLGKATVAPTSPSKTHSATPRASSPAPRVSATTSPPPPAPTGVGDVPAAPSPPASSPAGADQQQAGDLGAPQLPAASDGPPAVTAPDRRLTSGSPIPTGTIAGVVLAVAGVLLTLAYGFKLKIRPRRYRHSSSWSPRY